MHKNHHSALLVIWAALIVGSGCSRPDYSRQFTFSVEDLVYPGSSLEATQWADEGREPFGYVALLFSTREDKKAVADWYLVRLSRRWRVKLLGRETGRTKEISTIAEGNFPAYKLVTTTATGREDAMIEFIDITRAAPGDRDPNRISSARDEYSGKDAVTKFVITVVGRPD